MPREMFDRLNSPPKVWNPDEEGQWIAGTVVEISSFPSQYDDEVEIPVIAIDAEEGSQDVEVGEEYEVRAYRTVLRLELERKQPRVGDRLGVAYHGKDPAEDYHRYRVALDRRSAAQGTTLEQIDEPQRADTPEQVVENVRQRASYTADGTQVTPREPKKIRKAETAGTTRQEVQDDLPF